MLDKSSAELFTFTQQINFVPVNFKNDKVVIHKLRTNLIDTEVDQENRGVELAHSVRENLRFTFLFNEKNSHNRLIHTSIA